MRKDILDTAVEIIEGADAAETAYMARELIQCTLPHRDPGDVPLWTRTNGNTTLVLARTTYDGENKKLFGYPYGSIPRLILFFLISEAVRTGKRMIELGDCYADFLREIGLDPNTGGGKRGDGKRVREQATRLFAASIIFQREYSLEVVQGRKVLAMPVASFHELWWATNSPPQRGLWENRVELGEYFFNAATASPVPIDSRALRLLKRSPLALDLYAWAAHKAFVASQKQKSQSVSWRALMKQFGCDYASANEFQKSASAAFKKIQAAYPGLKLESEHGGLTVLKTSRPAIQPTQKSYPQSYANEKVINGERPLIVSPMGTVKDPLLDGEKPLIPYIEPVVVVKKEPVVIGVTAVTNSLRKGAGEGKDGEKANKKWFGNIVAIAATKFRRLIRRIKGGI